jgi:hypothetical protein
VYLCLWLRIATFNHATGTTGSLLAATADFILSSPLPGEEYRRPLSIYAEPTGAAPVAVGLR